MKLLSFANAADHFNMRPLILKVNYVPNVDLNKWSMGQMNYKLFHIRN